MNLTIDIARDWPIVAWATTLIFFCGGAWFELHRLRKDLGEIKPNVQKVPVLEQRLNGHEGWIRSIEERVNHGGD